MNRTTNILLGVILVLVVINLTLTLLLFGRGPVATGAADRMDVDIAIAWGDKVTELYNRQDYQALHALFNQQARVKIGREQLATQLEKLRKLFGSIDDHAYVNSIKLGAKGDEQYYQLFFNVRVSEKRNPATMKLSLAVENDEVSLYGLRINASESLD